ncbi:alginate lyase family protein [Streptomyces sp. enrichment culture]|uniref:alginate lyase family protein n=1 Tax=Streptomyces sp. enrichment culture TaxID=1795815 RepID=UPI003F567582
MRALGTRGVAAVLLVALVAGCGALDGRTRTMARALPPDAAFTHPGVLIGKAQLDTVRERVRAGKQPWLSAYLDMRDSRYGSYRYRPRPVETVACPGGARAGRGCMEERQDAIAAYTQALLFVVTGKRQHAAKATEIMDAWSARLTGHTGDDAGLQAGWAGSTWARAAELIRHTPGAGWPERRVARFEDMLRSAYLPEVSRPAPDRNGNWELVMTDAQISIAVFLNDHRAFDQALDRFRERVPAYFYLEKDGRLPRAPKGGSIDSPREITAYWFRQTAYRDGLAQETCRGLEHVGHALSATAHIAETAWHQGVDLYGEVAGRLKAAVELHARHQLGEPAPAWLCGGKVARTLGPDLEVALNHLQNRTDTAVPAARELAESTRPAGTDDLFVSWETLTHAGNPGD